MPVSNILDDQPIAWTPSPDVIERAQLTKFMQQVGVSTWDELYQFSIRDVEKFTEEVLKFLDIKFDPPYDKLLDTSHGIEFPRWFSRNADAPVRNDGDRNADALVRNESDRNADALVRNESDRNADALARNDGGRNADALARNDGGRNADALVRIEGEARTTAATFENKKGWHDRGYLRHFDGVATQFVTFRLADSLPQSVLRRLEVEIGRDNLADRSKEYRRRVEEYLDSGIGECLLKNPPIAEIVKATLMAEDGKSCRLIAWVIMPNHVHVLLTPLKGFSLSQTMQSIKSVSGHKINKVLGRTGSVWQPDYFDRYIRDADHFARALTYIENNPVKAGLCSIPQEWEFSSAAGTRTPSSAMSDGTRTPSSAMSAKHEEILSPEEPAIADVGVRVPTAGLNITTMCLDRWQTDEMKDQPAVIWEGENGAHWLWTYEDLHEQVDFCAAGLRYNEIGKGDAVGIFLPMSQDIVTVLLAIGRIGAIAVPVFSGYGVEAVASRMNAVGAKAIFVCDGFERRGKFIDTFSVATEAISQCPTIEKVFVRDSFGTSPEFPDGRFVGWHTLLDLHASQKIEEWQDKYFPEPTSAEDPLIILYTSGTTGKPKGIAHTHASFPIKAAQDMAFGTDVGRGTRICWYTDIGWMMGPWLIYGALINGATICIYDGAPDYPTPDRMWEFSAKHKVEVLGISPTLVRVLAAAEDRNVRDGTRTPPSAMSVKHEEIFSPEEPATADEGVRVPFERHDLSALRIFASTGEPWNPAPWWWLFEKVGNNKLPIINYSGGTEIAGGILMGNPLLPIKPCSFPAPCPGMDVDILDEEGNPVEAGKVGELVIKQPWIGMARGFWQEKERYLETYWRRFKDIWVHGDWAMRDADGHWFILGRSDDTLKVAGKRVGPAEVESILVSHPQVTEAAVIGVPDEAKGTAMVAFVVRNADTLVAASLEMELKALVAREMGKPLAPSRIHFVSVLPKTRNAKVMRRVIRSAYLGEDPGDLSSLENPRTVDAIIMARA